MIRLYKSAVCQVKSEATRVWTWTGCRQSVVTSAVEEKMTVGCDSFFKQSKAIAGSDSDKQTTATHKIRSKQQNKSKHGSLGLGKFPFPSSSPAFSEGI